MVKRSSKSKSKRTPLRKKYKILKKVKEHHKKKAKEEKKKQKAGAASGSGGKRKAGQKDPGIPAQWPFREQELANLEARKQRLEAEAEAKKVARAEKRKIERLGLSEDAEDVATLAASASKRDEDFERQQRKKARNSTESAALNDGSRKAFYKELMKVIEASDVIIQVLDARDPLGCRCVEVEQAVAKSGAHKRIVLLLNKIDLVPREVAEKWLKYFREELPTVAFKCSTQAQRTNLGQSGRAASTAGADALQSSESLGADTLIQLLKNYARNQKLKTSITVGVVGFPNVGKSSLINSLKRSKVANVGATPGVTKTLQEVHLDKHVKLLDCPGIVFASAVGSNEAAAVLRNCVRLEKLTDSVTPVQEIVKRCTAETLMSIYKIEKFVGAEEFLQRVAASRGKLKRGGVADPEAAAKLVLQDWNSGRIPYFTQPPKRESVDHDSTQLVTQWAKEFDIEEAMHPVFKNEKSALIEGLPSMESGMFTEMPAGQPLEMDMAEAAAESNDDNDDGASSDESEEDEEVVAAAAAPSTAADQVAEAMDSGEAGPSRGKKYLSQSEVLYNEEGMYNPHAARAEKKRRKKNASMAAAQDEDNSDYDFEHDFKGDKGQEGGNLDADADEDDAAEDEDEDEAEGMSGEDDQ
eukprot:jgi/Chlat1/66/Chrsp1S08772